MLETFTIEGAFGAIKSAASIAHAESLVNNNPASVTLEGETIDMVNGYPQAIDITAANTSGGILEAAQISADDFTIDSTNAGAAAGAIIIVRGIGAPAASVAANTCRISYTAAAANASPTIEIDDSGC